MAQRQQKLFLEELPYRIDSCDLFRSIQSLPLPIFLDSAAPWSQRGRYDILCAQPEKILSAAPEAKNTAIFQSNTSSYETKLNFFESVNEALKARGSQWQNDYQLPFIGGAMGYFGYDLGRQLEHIPKLAQPLDAVPDAVVGIYPWSVIVDHHNRRTVFVCQPHLGPSQRRDILARLKQNLQPEDKLATAATSEFRLCSPFQSNMDSQVYRRAFDRAQDYIQAGDCYQVNLAQRFSAAYEGDCWQAYRQLREIAAAPFSAYMQHEAVTVMSLSPERFLRYRDGNVSTKPIKGTRKRGANPEQDQQLADELIHSAKDRAENLMIVDLLRNDLGRCCEAGSIKVEKLFELQSFETVHHLVSTISGRARQGTEAIDILAKCFPGGSITGAPKIRAMQIIEELEPDRRSIYCGSLAYISADGQMDSNIAIRSLVAQQQQLHCWAGGGLVADSVCEDEYQECFNKVEKLLKALETYC